MTKYKLLVSLEHHSYGSSRSFLRGLNHLQSFIVNHYDVKVVMLNKIDLEFVRGFEQYLHEKKAVGQKTITNI